MFQITQYFMCHIYLYIELEVIFTQYFDHNPSVYEVEHPIFYERCHVSTQILDSGEYESHRDEGLLNLLNQPT